MTVPIAIAIDEYNARLNHNHANIKELWEL